MIRLVWQSVNKGKKELSFTGYTRAKIEEDALIWISAWGKQLDLLP